MLNQDIDLQYSELSVSRSLWMEAILFYFDHIPYQEIYHLFLIEKKYNITPLQHLYPKIFSK